MDAQVVLGWLIAPAAALVVGALAGKLSELRKRERARDERRDEEHRMLILGMRELMRTQLHEMHRVHVVCGEPMPYDEKERLEAVWSVYAGLGGNGSGKHLYEELKQAHVA